MKYGVFDRIIVDKGQEWNLLLFINESLKSFRHDASKAPHVKVSSKKVQQIICTLELCSQEEHESLVSSVNDIIA